MRNASCPPYRGQSEKKAKEIEIVSRLLKRGGLLILDDVSESWVEIEKVFATLDRASYARLGTDGRVGVAERI